MTWSKKVNNLYIGKLPKDNHTELKKCKSVESDIKFRVAKDSSIIQVGSENLKTGYYIIRENSVTISQSAAKEILDFQFTRVDQLISNCKLKDFLFETTIIQQYIVMLFTIFEVYLKERFFELCKIKEIDLKDLLVLIPKNERELLKKECDNLSKEENISSVEVFLFNLKKINFQNWDKSKKACSKIFNLKFGELNLNNKKLELIQKVLQYRHRIIHAKIDMTVLNIESVPPEKPIFANKEFGENILFIFKNFLETVHYKSMDEY